MSRASSEADRSEGLSSICRRSVFPAVPAPVVNHGEAGLGRAGLTGELPALHQVDQTAHLLGGDRVLGEWLIAECQLTQQFMSDPIAGMLNAQVSGEA